MANMSISVSGNKVAMRMSIADANILRDALTKLILKSSDEQDVLELVIEGDSVTVDTEGAHG